MRPLMWLPSQGRVVVLPVQVVEPLVQEVLHDPRPVREAAVQDVAVDEVLHQRPDDDPGDEEERPRARR